MELRVHATQDLDLFFIFFFCCRLYGSHNHNGTIKMVYGEETSFLLCFLSRRAQILRAWWMSFLRHLGIPYN